MYIQFFYIGFGIFLLYFGGNYLLKSSVNIAKYFKVPSLLIGVTIVSFSTSTPELFSGIVASLKRSNEIVVSNVIGSNIINVSLCLPFIGLFLPIKSDYKRLKLTFYILFLLMTMLLFFSFSFTSYQFFASSYSRLSSFLILVFFLIYLFLFYKQEKIYNFNLDTKINSKECMKGSFLFLNLLLFILSMCFLYLGSELLVSNSVYIANKFNVSERFIGIVLVALGTSIPELVVSIFSLIKKEIDIAFGNIIGSNIFNIGFILSINSLINPVFMKNIYIVDYSLMFALILILFFIVKKKLYFGKKCSTLFLFIFFLYNVFLFNSIRI